MKFSLLTTAAILAPAAAKTYLKELFDDEGWNKRWTVPAGWKPKSEMGEWKRSTGKYYAEEDDFGIKTGPDARHHGLSAKLKTPFKSSDGKDLVIQYSVKNEQGIDCGGAYIKLLPGGDSFDANTFGGDSPYAIMFGPDICGSSKRTHVILHSEKHGEGLLINKDIPCESDKVMHLYTLVVRPDNTFEVFVDNKSVRNGKLEEEFDFLETKEIKDPDQSKPEDWVDVATIPDPTDTKPEGYDDIPEEIPDGDVTKPEDWDDEDDGEWEPPMVDNPDFKGEWKPKMIPNPEYKGSWVHPIIPNPDYKYNDKMYAVCEEACTHVGFELWQVKSGTIFDDILITDSLEEAQKYAEEVWFPKLGLQVTMQTTEQDLEDADDADMDDDDDDYDPGMGDEF